MADQVTNLQLSKDIGDLKGSVGRIEGLLVGISSDLIAGRNKFVDIESRLRVVESAQVPEVEKRLRKMENKMAWYSGAAAIIGAIIGYAVNLYGDVFGGG